MAPSTPSLSLSPSHPTLIRTRPDGKSPYKPRAPHVRSSGGTTQLYRPPSAAPPASAADNFPQVGVTRAPTAPASAQQLLETPRQPFIAAEFESRSPWGLGRYDATLAVAHSRRPRRLHPTEAARPLQPWGFGSGMPRLLHPNRDAPDLLADVTPGPHDYVSFAQLQSFTTDARGGNHRAYGKRVEPAPQSERQRPRRKSSVAREHGARYPRGFGNSMPRLLHPNPDAPHVEHQSHSTPVRAPRNSARNSLGAQLSDAPPTLPQGPFDYVDFDKLQSFVSTKGGNKCFGKRVSSAGPLRSRSADHLLSTSASRASLGSIFP